MSEREYNMLQTVTYDHGGQHLNEVYKWEDADFVVIGRQDDDEPIIIGTRPEHLRELARLLEIAATKMELGV